jgi:hypothetical protein
MAEVVDDKMRELRARFEQLEAQSLARPLESAEGAGGVEAAGGGGAGGEGRAKTPGGGEGEEESADGPVARLMKLIRHNKQTEVETLLKDDRGALNWRDEHGNSALMVACQNGRKQIARLLIKNGADVNAQNVGGGVCVGGGAHSGSTGATRRCTLRRRTATRPCPSTSSQRAQTTPSSTCKASRATTARTPEPAMI